MALMHHPSADRGAASKPAFHLITSHALLAVAAFSAMLCGCGGGGNSSTPGTGPTGSSSSIGTGVPTPGSGVTGVVPAEATAHLSLLAGSDGGLGYRDGQALDAIFNGVGGIAIDSAGNRFIADVGNDVIRKIDTAGNVTTYAGIPGTSGDIDGDAASAEFEGLLDVAVDTADNLYVTESTNVVRKISPAGQVTTVAGTSGVSGSTDAIGPSALFNVLGAITTDSSGNVYVADSSGLTIRRITPLGAVTTIYGVAGMSFQLTGNPAYAFDITGLTFDDSGNLFFIDGTALRKMAGNGVITTLSQDIEVTSPTTLCNTIPKPALAWNGSELVALSGCSVMTISTTGSQAVFYNYPYLSSTQSSLAVDSAGNVDVTFNSFYSSEVDQITPGGVKTLLAGDLLHLGEINGTGSAAAFGLYGNGYEGVLNGVARDPAGNLYVSDQGTNTIRKITPAGVVSTFAGHPQYNAYGGLVGGYADGQGTAASFDGPSGIAVNSAGVVFVADTYNQTIRQITPEGMVTTFAGTPTSTQTRADGTGVNALFSNPGPVTIDKAGNLYVGDNYQTQSGGGTSIESIGGTTLRKITPAGVVTTIAGSSSTTGYADGPVASALFYGIGSIAIDPIGNIYVSDDTYIREITNGAVKTVYKPASYMLAAGSLAIDASGNFYFLAGPLIEKLDASGAVTTYAGSNLAGFRPGNLPGGLNGPNVLTIDDNGLAVTMSGAVAVIQ